MAAIALPTAISLLDVYDVRAFGAKGDGTTDDTTAIQSALTAAGSTGAICYAPPGNYLIGGNITVPIGVKLVGTYAGPPDVSPTAAIGTFPTPGQQGSTLSITGGSGNASGTPAFTLQSNSAIEGFVWYWPNQSATATTPTAYPWAVSFQSGHANATVKNCTFINPYQCFKIDFHDRACIERVVGQPLYLGLSVTSVQDVIRLSDIHFIWMFIYPPTSWQRANAIAYQFGRSDEVYAEGLFALGYDVAYQFYNQTTGTNPGQCYGEFVECGADDCTTAIQCTATATNGVRWVGSGFAGLAAGSGAFLSQSGGKIAFNGTGFWQSNNSFTQTAGNLLVNGCTFRDPATIALAGTYSSFTGNVIESASTTFALSGTGKATVTGNTQVGATFTVSGAASGGTVNANNN